MNNILASNLAIETTEEHIRELFVQFGAIERIKIITDHKTDRPTGVVFIEMADDEAAARAIAEIDGAELNGKTLHVNAARPRLHRSARTTEASPAEE